MPSTAPIKVPIVGTDEYSKAFKGMVKMAKKVGQSVGRLGRTLTTRLSLPLLAIGAGSIKMSRDLNKSMANVGTLIPGQTERLKKMRTQVQGLSVDMATSTAAITDGLYTVMSAFGTVEDPMSKLRTSMKMSVAGLSTVKEATSLLSAVTKGYGDISDKAATYAGNLAFKTVVLGETTFPELASSIGKVVPLAASLNISQQELFGTFATLTGVTGDAAEVATQFRSILAGLAKPTEKLTELAEDLEFANVEAMVKTKGFAGTVKLMGEYAGGSTTKMTKLMKRIEGVTPLLALTGGQAGTFAEKLAAMGDVAGTTDAAYREQTEGINASGFAMDKMVERVKVLAVKLGDKLLPIVIKIVDKLEPFIDKILSASDESFELGLKIAGVAIVLGPFLMILGKVITAVSTVVGWIGAGGLAGVLAFLTGPVGITVGVIGGLAAIMLTCWEETRNLREAVAGPFIEAWEGLKDLFDTVVEAFSGFGGVLRDLVGFISDLLAPLGYLAAAFALLPLKLLTGLFKALAWVLGIILDVIKIFVRAVQWLYYWLSDLFGEMLEGTEVGDALASAFEWVGEVIGSVTGFVKGLWDDISGFFSDIAEWLDDLGYKMDDAVEKQKKARALRDNKVLWRSLTSEELGLDVSAATFEDAIRESMRQTGGDNESTVNVRFANAPPGTEVTTDAPSRVNVTKEGSILDGPL